MTVCGYHEHCYFSICLTTDENIFFSERINNLVHSLVKIKSLDLLSIDNRGDNNKFRLNTRFCYLF